MPCKNFVPEALGLAFEITPNLGAIRLMLHRPDDDAQFHKLFPC